MPDPHQEWVSAQMQQKREMQDFVGWGLAAFLAKDESSDNPDSQHQLTLTCFEPFCDILAAHCFAPGDGTGSTVRGGHHIIFCTVIFCPSSIGILHINETGVRNHDSADPS